LGEPVAADLITITNPGWPVPWKGRTYRLSAFGPGSRARLAQFLQLRYLSQADDPKAALADIRAGKASRKSEWGIAELKGPAGLLLLVAASLSVRHPEITLADVGGMLSSKKSLAAIAAAMQLMAPAPAAEEKPRDRDDGDDEWPDIVSSLLRLKPNWTLDDIARLSDRQIEFIIRAAASDAGTNVIEGEFTLDDIEPLAPGGNSPG
jgi:hypothetical protein